MRVSVELVTLTQLWLISKLPVGHDEIIRVDTFASVSVVAGAELALAGATVTRIVR